MRLIATIFTVIGAIASVVCAIIAIMDFFPEPIKKNSIIVKLQVSSAQFFAPESYEVVPKTLDIIKSNTTFARSPGGSALLTQAKRVPFAVYRIANRKKVGVYIDGKKDSMKVGESMEVPGTNCSIWLFDIQDPEGPYSFELKCE